MEEPIIEKKSIRSYTLAGKSGAICGGELVEVPSVLYYDQVRRECKIKAQNSR